MARDPNDNKVRVNVMLAPEVLKRLEVVSAWTGDSRSKAIEKAVMQFPCLDPSEYGGGGGAALKSKSRPACKAKGAI